MEPGVTARHAAPPATHHPRITIETTRPKPTQADPAYREISRLGIDAVFGGYPLNKITREQISAWVQKMVAAGKKPSTVRHAYFLVRMVLAQAVADGRLATNPADYVKLPSESSPHGGTAGVVDDPAQFLTAAQVSALVDATPWPYNVYVHVAA